VRKLSKVISPFEFLEIAKLAGLIPNITKVMIKKSFETMVSNNYTFSINITEDDLAEEYLVDYLKEQTSKYNVNPNRVILEILEGVSAGGKDSHLSQLIELKKQGFKIAIDDFGAEYSNFERILDLDVDFIKIDAKYIKNIHKDKRSYEITKAIAFFAKNVNISSVAEFVHNEDVQKIIKELGINFSQGYLFSQPKKELLKSLEE
jgi:EAL domain-containing protein (putative c-di-GMP-specific phosphodiesterase class I)